jgi:hypothetical protein
MEIVLETISLYYEDEAVDYIKAEIHKEIEKTMEMVNSEKSV